MPDYNPSFDTPLNPTDEVLYQIWKKRYAPSDTGADYDLRGAFAAGQMPGMSGHWTDQFKKPNHPTFSVESQYAGAYPEKAGYWVGDTYVPARGLQKGTNNMMQTTGNNPGLRLFMQKRKLSRPQPFAKGSSGIHINPKNKGKFTALQKATGKSTAELKNSPNPLTRKRANFAMMAKRHFKPL